MQLIRFLRALRSRFHLLLGKALIGNCAAEGQDAKINALLSLILFSIGDMIFAESENIISKF